MNLKQLLMNGLFQQDESCVWLNLMYIYVTESNQDGLCTITITLSLLYLGSKALPQEYWQDTSDKEVYIMKSRFKGVLHVSRTVMTFLIYEYGTRVQLQVKY